MRLGLFGGAFDPPHLAHHRIAQAAIHTYALDRLYIVPTGDAWHKSRSLSPGQHRLAMARLAFADLPQAWIEPMEVEREGPSYTIDTLRALQARHPQATWYLFIGGIKRAPLARGAMPRNWRKWPNSWSRNARNRGRNSRATIYP